MDVTLREGAARALFGLLVAAIAAAAVLNAVDLEVLGQLFVALGTLAGAGAALLWLTEGRPIQDRAGDLGALTAVAMALLVYELVDKPEVQDFLKSGLMWIAFAAFVGGSVARGMRVPDDTANLVLAGTGVGLLFESAVAWFLLHGFDGLPTALLIGGVGLVVLYGLLDRAAVGGAVQSRPFQYGAGALVLSLLAGALAVGSYALAYRYDHTWDWTKSRAFTLSDHAKTVLEGLQADVKIVAYVRQSSRGRKDLEGLLERFREGSSHVSVEWVDPLEQPLRAKQAEVTGDQGTVILESNGKNRRLEGEIKEEQLTRALLLLASDEDHQVCWAMGHGEPDPDDEFSADGLGAARLELEGLNYKVRKIQVANVGIPRDCAVLIVARPNKEWFPYEKEALAAYVAEGGRALVMVDMGEVPDFAKDLSRFGVQVGDDVVIDLNTKNQMLGVNDPSFVVLTAENFGQHTITRNLSAAIVMPLARSVKSAGPDQPGLEVTDLLHTSHDAWGETDFEGTTQPTPDPNTELVGEVPVMAVVEVKDPAVLKVAPSTAKPAAPEAAPATPSPEAPPDMQGDIGRAVPADFAPKAGGRLVVIGDSDFAANQYLDWGNNRDLFLNSVAWLAAEEDQIGERPPAGEKLALSVAAQGLWCLLSVGLVPGLAAGIGIGTLAYRRYRL